MRRIFSTFILFFAAAAVFAQTGTVRGFVYAKESGEPVMFANVFIEGTTFGSITEANGFYSLAKIPAGTYWLIASSVEYDSIRVQVTVKADQIASQSFYLEKRTVTIGQIDISAQREEARTETQVSTVTITPKEITLIPSVGGEADVAQLLQIIPGVIFTGDQGGQIYIRGGSPVQTKVLLDGITIYNPFHSIGLYSVFETDIIRSVDVYTGGFGAEYGGRISGIIDIKTRDGNKTRFGGNVAANPFLAKATLEGPLMKMKENGSSISYLLNTKWSYLDKTSKKLYSYVDDEGQPQDGLPFSFNDYYGKLSFNTSNGSKLNLFGFHFKDRAEIENSADLEWNSLGFGTNFVVVPGQTKSIMSGNFAYSNYDVQLNEADGRPRSSSVGGFNLGLAFNYFLKDGEVAYGFDINGFKTEFQFFNSLGLAIDQDQNTTELGFFFRYKKAWKAFVLEPSFRAQYYASLAALSLEPRLGAKVNFTDNFRLKFAGGVYSQNLISGKSDRDVVNLFTSFISGPEEKLTDPDGEEVRNNIQRAYHAVAGIEYNLTRSLELTVEGYYKYFGSLIEINRNKLQQNDPNYIVETGDAYGLDVLLKYDYKKLYVWSSYSLGYVTRFDGEQEYHPHYDRRHNFNIVTSYTFGKKPQWEASARWNFGSGFPFTRTQAFFPDLGSVFAQNGIQTNYVTANVQDEENIGILYEDELNAGRLPAFHRLDLSLKCHFIFSERVSLDIIAAVTNVYNRANIFYFDRIRFQRVDQLPFLPSLGLSLSF